MSWRGFPGERSQGKCAGHSEENCDGAATKAAVIQKDRAWRRIRMFGGEHSSWMRSKECGLSDLKKVYRFREGIYLALGRVT